MFEWWAVQSGMGPLGTLRSADEVKDSIQSHSHQREQLNRYQDERLMGIDYLRHTGS